MTIEKIKELLKSRDMQITQNRISIIQCLSDGQHFHAISEIIKHVKNLNTKSIYNNIKALIDKGIVDSYSFGGVSKYALNDNLKSQKSIHLIDSESNVSHLEVSPVIFKKIAKEVKEHGKKVKTIKIYVDIE